VAVSVVSLLLAIGAGWIYAHRGYRGVVYYEAMTVVTSWDQREGRRLVAKQAAIQLEEWVDPQAEVRREQLRGVRWYVLQAGYLEYTVRGPGDAFPRAVSRPAAGVESWRFWHSLQDGGWSDMGKSLLRSTAGTVVRWRLDNRQALRFAAGQDSILADAPTVWLDASTLTPLRYQWRAPTKARYVETYDLTTSRIAPGMLPSNFFSVPPPPHTSFWDRFGDWLRDRGVGHP